VTSRHLGLLVPLGLVGAAALIAALLIPRPHRPAVSPASRGAAPVPPRPEGPATTTATAGLDLRNVRLRMTPDGLAGSLEYTLVVGTYYEWNTDPTAVPGLMSEVTRRTGVRAGVCFSPVALDERRVRRNPLLIMTGNRFFRLSRAEKANLRGYLHAGGFIYADDCGGADRSFREMIKDLLPEADLIELPGDHPILNTPYRLGAVPKVLDLYHGPARGYAAYLDGRLAVFYTHDTDVPCGWEKNPDGSFVHMLDEQRHELSYRLGVNVVMYVLGELQRRQELAATTPTARTGASSATCPSFAGAVREYRMKPQMPCSLILGIAPAGRHVWLAGRRTLPGEQEGLARFDYRSERWEIFLDSEGVLADEINCLASGTKGIWIGTSSASWRWNHGLWHYDPAARKSRRYTTADGLVDERVYDLLVRRDNLYAATRRGLARLDLKTGRWHKDPAHSENYTDAALCLAADDRYVWAGRTSGLLRYDTREDAYKLFDRSNSPVGGMVNALAADGRRLWVAAQDALLTYRDGKFEEPAEGRRIAQAEVLTAASDGKWVCLGTRTGGLHVLDTAEGTWRAFDTTTGLPANCIRKVALDDRSIWCAFGDEPLGVGRYDRRAGKWSFFGHRAGIPCNHLYCLARRGDRLYLGTMANGLWARDVARGRWVNLEQHHRAEHATILRADVYDLLPGKDELWFGTNLGLCRYRHGADTYEPVAGLNASVAAVAFDGPRVLCGTRRRGLMAYDPQSKSWADLSGAYGLAPGPITALARDARGIWVGTEQGLLLLDRAAGKAVALPAGLSGTPVTALLADGPRVYVGTPTGLLRCDARTRAVTGRYLRGEHVLRILPAGAGLLVGTRTGLASIRPGGDRAVLDPRFAGRAVTSLAVDDKYLWIGTLGHGLARAERSP